MEEESRQEEIAVMISALSAIDVQLQELERTAKERSSAFWDAAEQSETPACFQFNTMAHLLREFRSDVHEIREHIDSVGKFIRTGRYEVAKANGMAEEVSEQCKRTRSALKKATNVFERASNALYVVSRALETEEMGRYADHVRNLSDSVEAEAEKARSLLKPVEGGGVVEKN